MTSSASPRASVILATHNAGPSLVRAVQSVLDQTFQDFEMLIVDDGSDVLPDLPQDPRVRVIRNERNLGLQASLNRGLAEARGEYVARIDDDDEWCAPQKLSEQVAYLDAHPRVAVVGTGATIVNEHGAEGARYSQPLHDAEIRRAILLRNPMLHVSVLMRRAALGSRGYDESPAVRYAEDYELWLRLGTGWQLANLQGFYVKFSMHADSATARHKLEQCQNFTRLIREYHAAYPQLPYWYVFVRSKVREVLYGRMNLWHARYVFFSRHAKPIG
jgi:glycosyltransferase involved in cell wall biosynthesis